MASTDAGTWIDWGGDGPPLHLAHGNGFPPGTYRRLAEVLKERFHVVSMAARPLWNGSRAPRIRGWSLFADDLREELTARGLRGIIGVGHSLGAATSLLAAVDDPGLFSAVVAVDPIVLTGATSVAWGVMKRFGLAPLHPLVRGALARHRKWPSRGAVREAYWGKKMFRGWRQEVFDDYVESAFEDANGEGVRLRFPRRWEARIFEVSPHNLWPRLRELAVPVLFVQGERSDTFVDAARLRVARELPTARVAVVPGAGHFVPMEEPEGLGRVILEYLNSLQPQEAGRGRP